MQELQALIFDVDGTLADTERDGHRVAFNAAFEAAGLDWHWDEALYGRLLETTGGKERIRQYIQQNLQEFTPPKALDEFIADLHKSKTAYFVDLLNQGRIPLRTGVARLLREARTAGIRLAVATTTTIDNVTALLSNTLGDEADGLFEVIAAGDVVAAKKPAPDIYHWAMDRLDLPATACLALEDSQNGLAAALDSGIRSVVITVNGYTMHEKFTGASLVVDQLGEPGSAPQVLQGNMGRIEQVDLDLLRQVHGNSLGQ